jgi:hypothetical protein
MIPTLVNGLDAIIFNSEEERDKYFRANRESLLSQGYRPGTASKFQPKEKVTAYAVVYDEATESIQVIKEGFWTRKQRDEAILGGTWNAAWRNGSEEKLNARGDTLALALRYLSKKIAGIA